MNVDLMYELGLISDKTAAVNARGMKALASAKIRNAKNARNVGKLMNEQTWMNVIDDPAKRTAMLEKDQRLKDAISKQQRAFTSNKGREGLEELGDLLDQRSVLNREVGQFEDTVWAAKKRAARLLQELRG